MIKYTAELQFWINHLAKHGGHFPDGGYRWLMLSLLEADDDTALQGKIVADFGCGPQGSLCWTESPARCFGIDVLVPAYLEYFGDDMKNHSMEYVPCTESSIPLPDNSVDVLFTINSLDHVQNLEVICGELLRILKPGGLFAGSFNLHEPACPTEPQCLDEPLLRQQLFRHLNVKSYRVALKHSQSTYANFQSGNLIARPNPNKPCILWVTGEKRFTVKAVQA